MVWPRIIHIVLLSYYVMSLMNTRHVLNQAFIPLVALPLHDSRTPTSVKYFYCSYLGDNLCSMMDALAIGVLWLLIV